MKINEQFVENSTKEIRKGQTVLFCGAGISFHSGLPIVPLLLNYLFGKIKLTPEQSSKLQQSRLPFESIMEMVLRESQLDEIQEMFLSGKPNSTHYYIAKLAKHGYTRTICTTNFDLFIERALEEEGLVNNKDFEVYSNEEDFKKINWNNEVIKVIKIHGCASKKEEMAITMELIASERFAADRKLIINRIFRATENTTAFVMGYSCSDIDLCPLIEAIREQKSEVLFIDHITTLKKPRTEGVHVKKVKNPFKEFRGNRIYANTDEFIEHSWKSLFDDEYFFLQSTVNWQDYVDEWYMKSESESGRGVGHHISSRLLYAIGEFREAVEHHKKAIEIANKEGNRKAYAAELGNLGMCYNQLAEYEKAKDCFTESIPICKAIGHTDGLSSQLQSYGNLLHHTGQNELAIRIHLEAISIAEKEKDEYSLGNSFGNISNAYLALRKYEEALTCLDKGLAISKKLGNKQAESSQLGILAKAYFFQGNQKKALELNLQGIAIKKEIGDKQGECQMLLNNANVYNALNKPTEFKNCLDECLKIAVEIGNKQVQYQVRLFKEIYEM